MQTKKFETVFGGEKLVAEFSDLADQTNGSVLVRYGGTVVFATAVMSKRTKDGLDYFPLSVDYQEKFYAVGMILGGRFMKREGRPSDEAILSGRIVDRTIRPLFNSDLRNEVQVVVTILSLDKYDPDVLGVIAASLALGTSPIPWGGPVSAVRIGKSKNGTDFLINPSYEMRSPSTGSTSSPQASSGQANSVESDYELDVFACGKDGTINMIEVGANEASEETLMKALEKANEELQKIQKFQEMIIKEIGQPKSQIKKTEIAEDLKAAFEKEVVSKFILKKRVVCIRFIRGRICYIC